MVTRCEPSGLHGNCLNTQDAVLPHIYVGILPVYGTSFLEVACDIFCICVSLNCDESAPAAEASLAERDACRWFNCGLAIHLLCCFLPRVSVAQVV